MRNAFIVEIVKTLKNLTNIVNCVVLTELPPFYDSVKQRTVLVTKDLNRSMLLNGKSMLIYLIYQGMTKK